MGKYIHMLEKFIKDTQISNCSRNQLPGGSVRYPFALNASLATDCSHVGEWIDVLIAKGINEVAIDIETTGLNVGIDQICGIALAHEDSSLYIPLAHAGAQNILFADIKSALTKVTQGNLVKLFHNATFDVPFLMKLGLEFEGDIFDTRLLLRSYTDRSLQSYKLKELATDYIHPKSDVWERELVNTLKSKFGSTSKGSLHKLLPSEAKDYACADVVLTLRLYREIMGRKNIRESNVVYLSKESEVAKVISTIVERGFAINEKYKRQIVSSLKKDVDELEPKIFDNLRKELNLNSNQQLLDALSAVGCEPRNKDGKPTVAVASLKMIENPPEVVGQLIHRSDKISKLRSISSIDDFLVEGRIFPSIMVSAQLGERFSCTKPSLYTGGKNESVSLRSIIAPETSFFFMSADFKSSHFRLFAHLSGDPEMIRIFNERQDFHKASASLLFEKPYEEVTTEERSQAKVIGLSIFYGMGIKRLADSLGTKEKKAQELKNKFLYEKFSIAGQFIKQTNFEAKRDGHITTGLWHQKIAIPKDQNFKSINYLIQGTESELLKEVLIDLENFLAPHLSFIALPFHDEVLFQIHKLEENLIPSIVSVIEKNRLSVPVESDVKTSKGSWAELEPYKVGAYVSNIIELKPSKTKA